MANNLSSQAGLAWVGAAVDGQAYDVPGSLDPGTATGARVSQEMAETLLQVASSQVVGRVSQEMAEVLLQVANSQVFGRVSQVMVEVLISVASKVERRGSSGRWFGDLNDVTSGQSVGGFEYL